MPISLTVSSNITTLRFDKSHSSSYPLRLPCNTNFSQHLKPNKIVCLYTVGLGQVDMCVYCRLCVMCRPARPTRVEAITFVIGRRGLDRYHALDSHSECRASSSCKTVRLLILAEAFDASPERLPMIEQYLELTHEGTRVKYEVVCLSDEISTSEHHHSITPRSILDHIKMSRPSIRPPDIAIITRREYLQMSDIHDELDPEQLEAVRRDEAAAQEAAGWLKDKAHIIEDLGRVEETS